MKKIALLFGINYRGTDSELNGCINDVTMMADKLITIFKYDETRIFTDDTDVKPTREVIITEIEKLMVDSQTCTEIFIHYSGHGGSYRDNNGDEKDGYDEVIFPLDYKIHGYIKDDTLHDIIVKTKCDLRIVLDCCNSGTGMDLCHNLRVKNNQIISFPQKQKTDIDKNILMISGCLDEELAYDIFHPKRQKYMGALSSTLLDIYDKYQDKYKNLSQNKKNKAPNEIPIHILIQGLTTRLKERGLSQNPVISSNKPINTAGFFISSDKNKIYKPALVDIQPVNIQSAPMNAQCSGGCSIQ